MSGKLKKAFMKKIIILLILILVLIAGFIVVENVFPGFRLSIPFVYNKKSSSSEIILREINKVSTLSTVEYIYKSVFPFDFFDKDTDWRMLLSKRTKEEKLTESDIENLWIFDECRSIGINLIYPTYDFVVITSIVEAGMNLGESFDPQDIKTEGKTVTLRMPRTIITNFTIEDSDSSTYKYPDLNVDPFNWKKITNYVEEKIQIRVVEDGVLKTAEKRGRDFIESVLIESGWEKVIFVK